VLISFSLVLVNLGRTCTLISFSLVFVNLGRTCTLISFSLVFVNLGRTYTLISFLRILFFSLLPRSDVVHVHIYIYIYIYICIYVNHCVGSISRFFLIFSLCWTITLFLSSLISYWNNTTYVYRSD